MERQAMVELVSRLAEAKSRQNIEEALTLLHSDMLLETPALGSVARGEAANQKALTRFFQTFPDYEIGLERYVAEGETLVCWGTAHMTLTGDRFGVRPNGCRAHIPVMIEFGFRDGMIAHERFLYDLSVLCSQSGVSTDAVRQKLFGEVLEAGAP